MAAGTHERGQVAIEWLGILLLVALLAFSLVKFAPGLGARVSCEVSGQIEQLGGGSPVGCGEEAAQSRPVRRAERRTPFGAPNAPRSVSRRSPSQGGPRVQRVALPAAVPAAISAVLAACKIGKKACVKAIKTACKIPFAGGLCKRVKKIGCKLAKVYCKPRPKPPAKPKLPKWKTSAISNGRLRAVADTLDPSDKGRKLTYAGRALVKRKGAGSFPKPTGTQAAINKQGLKVVDRILTHPSRTQYRYEHPNYGRILEVNGPPSVGGVRFALDANGNVTRLIHLRVVKPYTGRT